MHRFATLNLRTSLTVAVAAAGLLAGSAATAQTPQHTPATPHATPHAEPIYFVRINGQEIGAAEFDRFAREAFRQKFYHGQPPEAEVQNMLRTVGQDLIDNVLLAAEAERRKIGPDKAAVEAEIAKYEKQYAKSENWQAQRDTTLPRIRAFLESKSRVSALEKSVRDIPTPKDEAVRAFYKKSPDLFTEPEKIRVSVILLKVAPSAPASAWEAALNDANGLYESIKKGVSFEKLARERSQDGSKDNGGDMGYLHRGMLAEEVHKEIDRAKPGEILKPIRILEGIAIFRLTERQVAKLRAYDDVKERATGLLKREQANKAWENFLVAVRSKAKIEIHPRFSEIMQPAKAQPTVKSAAPGK